jgi:glyoxylase-like metal-dependent hydrolase (beta-lactamase superfamily II)
MSGEPEPELIDLVHSGRRGAVGAWLLGDVIVDPGPASSMQQLMAGLEGRVPRALALTHIHLDHAGASGSLAARFPDLEVWVHERGAPHLADPSKLLASATRLYGDEMERLWGEVLPVPPERMRVLGGGETIGPFEVAYTPGHAVHHVSYLHRETRCAYTGDVAGVRIGHGPVMAPTPPPDIDLPAWRASIDLIDGWRPSALAVTHFGRYENAAEHLADLRAHLDEIERLAEELEEADYVAAIQARAGAGGETGIAPTYGQTMPAALGYRGMRRYLARRDAPAGA